MNIFKYFKDRIYNILLPSYKTLCYEDVKVEYPKNKEHGDLSTNVAMVIAKTWCTPMDIANELAHLIKHDEHLIEDISVAGAGFLNIKLKGVFWSLF